MQIYFWLKHRARASFRLGVWGFCVYFRTRSLKELKRSGIGDKTLMNGFFKFMLAFLFFWEFYARLSI